MRLAGETSRDVRGRALLVTGLIDIGGRSHYVCDVWSGGRWYDARIIYVMWMRIHKYDGHHRCVQTQKSEIRKSEVRKNIACLLILYICLANKS